MEVNMDAKRGDRVRTGGKVGGMRGEGIPSRFGASQLMSEHWPQNRLASYTSSLHVKGWLYCSGLTAYLTCLD